MNVKEVLDLLQQLSDSDKVKKKAERFNISAEQMLGVYMTDLNTLARELGKEANLAIELYRSGIYEGRLLCAKVFPPEALTVDLMEQWVAEFENWEICDTFSMQLFARSALGALKAIEWTRREEEFVKRAGFAIMAAFCLADKNADNRIFRSFLEPIQSEADDNRIYVRKAISWALRNIGKRNQDLHSEAIAVARKIGMQKSAAGRWIAADVLRELESAGVKMLDYPRITYRPQRK
jgi:3-methyladenine DNA glycosylase AlkD